MGPLGFEAQATSQIKTTSLYGTYSTNGFTVGLGIPNKVEEKSSTVSIVGSVVSIEVDRMTYSSFLRYEMPLLNIPKSKLFFNVTGDWTEIKTTGLDLDKWSNAYALHMGASTRITRNVKLMSGTMIYGKVNDPNGESDDSYVKSTLGGFYGAVQFRF